jgi:hypothetical protein
VILINIWLVLGLLLNSLLSPQQQTTVVTPDQIIQAVNAVRTGNGLPPLRTNPILMGTAQYTADLMASNQAAGHPGSLKERIIAAGYGSGYPSDSIWGTENFAIGTGSETASKIISGYWSDEMHMIPMVNSYYCDVGAGVAQTGDGSYYYVLHAAYNSDASCGKPTQQKGTPVSLTITPTNSSPQWIVPIVRATPDAKGRIIHTVRQGQSLWYIAISYGTRINSILQLNNLPMDTDTLYSGERLLIPTSLTPIPTITATPNPSETLEEATIPPSIMTLIPGTSAPSQVPTIDPADRAAEDERFRGGLFIALVIGIVLIVGGILLNRR